MEITKFYADVCVLLGSAVAMLFLRTARPARDTMLTILNSVVNYFELHDIHSCNTHDTWCVLVFFIFFYDPEHVLSSSCTTNTKEGKGKGCGVTSTTCTPRTCLVKLDFCAKALPHISHTNGREPVCVRWWRSMCIFCLKLELHPGKGQTNGRSPVCFLT